VKASHLLVMLSGHQQIKFSEIVVILLIDLFDLLEEVVLAVIKKNCFLVEVLIAAHFQLLHLNFLFI
jgi:hypothetical protein